MNQEIVPPSSNTSSRSVWQLFLERAHLSPIVLLPFASVFTDRVGPLLVVVTVLFTMAYRFRVGASSLFVWPKLSLPLVSGIMLFGWMLLSSLWSSDPAHSLENFGKITLVILSGVYLMNALTERPEDDIFWMLIVSLTLALIFCFIKTGELRDLVFSNYLLEERAGDPINRTTLIISVFIMMMVLQVMFLFDRFSLARKAAVFALFIGLIFLTIDAPGHAPPLLIAVTLAVAFLLKLKLRILYFALPILAAFLMLAMPLLTQLILEYGWQYKDAFDGAFATEFLTTGRVWIWHLVVNHVAQAPWIGFGLGMDKVPLQPFVHPHNGALQILINLGIIGVILFASWVALTLRHGGSTLTNNKSKLRAAHLAMAFGLFCVAMVAHGIWQGWWLAMVVVALNTRLRFYAGPDEKDEAL